MKAEDVRIDMEEMEKEELRRAPKIHRNVCKMGEKNAKQRLVAPAKCSHQFSNLFCKNNWQKRALMHAANLQNNSNMIISNMLLDFINSDKIKALKMQTIKD